MSLSEMVVKSKLIPPQPQKTIFHRARLQEKFKTSFEYPLTVIHAGTGFGKTTTLIELSSLYKQVYWYNLTEPDRDPALFMAHLISAFLPGTAHLLNKLEKGSTVTRAVFTALLNQLTLELEEDAILVLDDFHLVSDVQEINHWFTLMVENHPPHLHIAIASRKLPETQAFIKWRVKNSVLLIDQADLSFTEPEIADLFSSHYRFEVSPAQASDMYSYTDGWIIALQMIWQRLQSSRTQKLDNILAELPSALSEVFNFLAQDVLLRQPEDIKEFLVSSAVLQQMEAKVCNALLERTDSAEVLKSLVERGLFTLSTNDIAYRYQRLFQDFLLSQFKDTPEKLRALHKKAADFYMRAGNPEEAIHHLFASGELNTAADLIEQNGPRLLETGRLRTLAGWAEQLDPELLDMHPQLWLLIGDVNRLRSHFDQAISAYGHAEKVFLQRSDRAGRSQALRSQAQVYLDTIRPIKASSLLEEAISLLEPQEYPAEVSAMLDQLAENKLNLGRPAEAQTLHQEASLLRDEAGPDDIYLEARALLRTGHLNEAIELFEPFRHQKIELSGEQRPQRFHREMPLLLSLIHLMLGEVEEGERYARQGIDIGRQLDSPFVEAVGWMRLGHASQIYPQVPWRVERLRRSREYYERSIELVRPFNVMRVQVEPLWGLCRWHGYQGNLTEANRFFEQASEIAAGAGDQWFLGLLLNTMGISYALAANFTEAEKWLTLSYAKFSEVGDVYGQAAAQSARILNYWQAGSERKAIELFAAAAPHIKLNQHGNLFCRATQIGIQDPQVFRPILINAYQQGIERDWVTSLLPDLDQSNSISHPGYGLNIRMLGPFEVWRGKEPTNPRDWQREKARQLFQFILNKRGKWFTREQLTDRLWPELDLDSSMQNLKVALNALNHALEPQREAGQQSFFIIRKEASLGLNPAASIQIDMDDFQALAGSDEIEDMQEALSIYKGDFLNDSLDADWAFERREHLHEMFLQTARKLADKLCSIDRLDEAMKICHEILAVDPCFEPAYRILMRCHASRGNLAAVHAVYQRCAGTLEQELAVEPSSETTEQYRQLTK